MQEDPNTLTLRDYPTGLWITGGVMMAFGLGFFIINPASPAWLIVNIIIGGLFFVLPRALTITADKGSQMLRLRYQSPFRNTTKEIPFREIASIDLDASHDSDGSTYRIIARCTDGSTIPFRSYYSSGTKAKRKKIEQLQAFLGLPGRDGSLQEGFGSVFQGVQEQFQAAATVEAEDKLTDGVHWRMQTATLGNSTIDRWSSADVKFPNGFLFLAQKGAGQRILSGALQGPLEKILFPPLLKLYGFGPADTPGVAASKVLTPLDPHLEPHFSAFTSDPEEAKQVLNTWAVHPLEDWAVRYPLKSLQSKQLFGQLIVLFSPQGLYLATMGHLIPEAVDELTTLGVRLVKSQ